MTGSGWTFSPYVLSRRGALPFRDLAALVPRRTWSLLEEARALGDARRRMGDELIEVLHQAIPAAPPAARRTLLALRRDVHNDRAPSARSIAAASGCLPARAAPGLSAWLRARADEDALLAAAEQSLRTETRTTRQVLSELIGREPFVLGVQLSGRKLRAAMAALRGAAAEDDAKATRRARATAISFLYRMALKTSPFGAFTELAAYPWDAGSPPSAPTPLRRTVQIARFALNWIERRLVELDEGQEHLPLRLANTLRRTATHVELFTRGADGTDQMYGAERFLRLPLSAPLAIILDQLGERELPRVQLAAALAAAGVPVEEGRTFVERLVEVGVLERSLGVADQEPSYVQRMAEAIGRVPTPRAARCAASLGALADLERRFPEAGSEARVQLLDDLKRELASFAEVVAAAVHPDDDAIANLFEDVGRPGPVASWDPALLQREREHLGTLLLLFALFDPSEIERIGLYELFVARHGTGARVDLLDFYREFAKLDPRAVSELMTGAGSARAAEVRALARAFLEHLAARLDPCASALAIDPGWLRELVGRRSDGGPVWSSASIRVQVHRGTGGDSQLVVNGAGPGEGARFSRFCALFDDEVAPWSLRQAVAGEIRRRAGGRPQVDLGAVLGINTNLHPPLSELELEYPRSRSARCETALNLRELDVGVDPERAQLALFRRADGRPLQFVPLTFLFPVAGPSLYRFLFLFTPFLHFSGGFWHRLSAARPDPGGPSCFPRLTLGDLVIDRRTWRCPAAMLPTLKPAAHHRLAGLRAAEELRVRLGLPRECFFRVVEDEGGDGPTDWTDELKKWMAAVRGSRRRKPHYLDFRSLDLANLLWRYAKGIGPGTITFQECLPATDDYLSPGGPSSAEEHVIELRREAAS